MYTQEVTINNEVGLHARPATYFIRKANEFKIRSNAALPQMKFLHRG